MPIATAITIVLIMVYMLLRAVKRMGELLVKVLMHMGGSRNIKSAPTIFLPARLREMREPPSSS
jgi:Na+/H+ antiporter NhaD/arsenite permease-like protein